MPAFSTPESAAAARLRLHWERLAIAIRCATQPDHPQAIRRYLLAGSRLARGAGPGAAAVYTRMLRVLLQAAADDALPPFWRSVCAEHLAWPLARLLPILRREDAPRAAALEAEVQAAWEQAGRGRAATPAAATGAAGDPAR